MHVFHKKHAPITRPVFRIGLRIGISNPNFGFDLGLDFKKNTMSKISNFLR